MGVSRRTFTRQFKLAAVRRLEAGVSIAEVARGLEVNPIRFKCSNFSLVAGPRLNFKNESGKSAFFLHALMGMDRASLGLTMFDVTAAEKDTSLAIAWGGGGDQWMTPHVGIRFQADYFFTRHFHNLDWPVQNSFRLAAGVVFRFGGGPTQNTLATSRSREGAGMIIPPLAIRVRPAESDGAEIVEVLPSGVGHMAGLRVGDIVKRVDGKAVKTPMELGVEVSNRAPGSQLRLSYLRGYWESETVVLLNK